MATKSYQYVHNGSSFNVNVSFAQGSCLLGMSGPSGEETYYSDITVSIPSAIPVDLYVDIEVKKDAYTYTGSGSTGYYEQIKIPAGSTTQTESKVCKFVNGSDEEVYTYTLADQRNVEAPPPGLGASYTKQDVSCFGAKNGSITVTTMGGTSPFSYAWSDGGPNQAVRTNLPAGTYSVSITDANGQQAGIIDIEIAQPTQIQAAITVVDATCYGGSNGSISVTVSGGSGSYSFKWSDGSTTRNRTGMKAGNYTLTVSDSAGCSRAFNITVGQPTQIRIVAGVSGRDVTIAASGGQPPYSYLWSDNVTVKDRTDLADGTYTITVRDSNNCQESAIVNINDFKFYFSKNPVWLQLQASDPLSKLNLSFKCDVYLEDAYQSESFDMKYSTEHPARIDGSTDFDMQEVLNAFLSSNVPAFGESQPLQVAEAFKRFYFEHTEVFGEPPVPAPYTQVETFYVLFGGLSTEEFAKGNFFTSYLDNQKPFLSWQPRIKEVVPRQHEYLHYVVCNPDYSELNLHARIRYQDGTEQEVLLRTVSNVKPYEVYRFPAGPAQLDLGSINPGQLIDRYTLYLKSANQLASEERTYRLINEQTHYRIFQYLNSLGGWDTLLAKGRGRTSLRTSEQVIDRELPVNYAYSTRAKEVISKAGEKKAMVVIGSLTNSEKRHLVDLAISEKVYEQTRSGYLPVDVKFDFNPTDHMNELDEEVSFEVIYPVTNRYTPEL